MGPFELMDLVGLDIANHVGQELNLAPETDNVLASLVKQGKLPAIADSADTYSVLINGLLPVGLKELAA